MGLVGSLTCGARLGDTDLKDYIVFAEVLMYTILEVSLSIIYLF